MDSLVKSVSEDNPKEEGIIYKLVPWINWEEWNFVRESLFSSSPQSISTALKRVSTWKLRGCLPIVIDVTASIIEIQQKDPLFRKDLNSDAFMSEGSLAMLYCMAIIRLVNGVVDQDRNRRGKKDKRELSISQAADEILLPRMLIDIRHEASHRDLPSLQLVREASIKALEWLKSYYWEPQKNAIPLQRDKVDFVRKKMKSKLQELAFHLDMTQDSELGSLPMKRKRHKQSATIFGGYNHISLKAKKLQGSQSRGPKNQITRILRVLFRLYNSFPSEVVALLLDFLLKALDSSGSNGEEPSESIGVDLISERSKAKIRITDLCKFVITKLSSKEPELILVMLKAVLEKLETHEMTGSETGKEFLASSQSKAARQQRKRLSSLFLSLIEIYIKVKSPSKMAAGGEIQDSLVQTNAPRVGLAQLLRKCLTVSCPPNTQLAKSALLLAQIMGNSSLVDRLRKFPGVKLPNSDCTEEKSDHTGVRHSIIQHVSSISQAAENLEFLKQRQNKDKAANIVVSSNGGKIDERWTVAKSWNPCPIGMLPSSVGSTGVLPILDKVTNMPEVQSVLEGKEFKELSHSGEIMYGTNDVEFSEGPYAIEEETTAETDHPNDPYLLPEPFKGQLMIGGVYKNVCREELLSIESAVGILV